MKRLLFIMSLISITFPSCEQWDEFTGNATYDGPDYGVITVNFTQTVNGVELTTNNMIYTNEAGENYDVKTLKYIISNIIIIDIIRSFPSQWSFPSSFFLLMQYC